MGFFDIFLPKRKPSPPPMIDTPAAVQAPVVPILPPSEPEVSFVGAALPMTEADIAAAARTLGCPVAAVKAVIEVESAGSGFMKNGRPKILFESHYFGRLTGYRFNGSHPDISTKGSYRAGYSGDQYSRLERAMKLDPDAALKSASWGAFQVMGVHHEMCGYPTVQEFVGAAMESEGHQLQMLVSYCQATGLHNALRKQDWARFALGYNGSGYKANAYDVKLANAYRKHGGR
jgi:hypothetical protein